jgi:hypothetical protein
LEIKFLPNRRIYLFWRPFWIQNGHHSKPTMDINSQHDNRLGNHISSNKIQKSSDLDEIWLPSRLRCCELKSIVCFAMVAILNTKWPPKYKNPPIWTKCGFQVDYHVANWYPSLVCYDGHFESKMAAKIKKSPDLEEIWSEDFCILEAILYSKWPP